MLSSAVTPELQEAARLAADGNILIVDDRSSRVSMLNTFGFLLPDAVELASAQRRTVWLVPPEPGTHNDGRPAPLRVRVGAPRRPAGARRWRDWVGAGANVLR